MDTTVDSMAHGAILHLPGVAKVETEIQKEDLVAVMTLKGELVAYGRSSMTTDEMMEKQRGVVMHPLRVFMETGVYPKVERERKDTT